eukprot:NODE_1589_length_802_cov_64.194074_g1540_i0.p1 GENE.NODE_1589_length_802_cov_64.194074_g1540_i0~~NODE_1589_length_802_cov_64.194074_g1540_i0.p1  ORF type:complete len:255 (-),score=28.36 NODE_1589_length_802_cov_64.194074_g1540_i0:5-769(-)
MGKNKPNPNQPRICINQNPQNKAQLRLTLLKTCLAAACSGQALQFGDLARTHPTIRGLTLEHDLALIIEGRCLFEENAIASFLLAAEAPKSLASDQLVEYEESSFLNEESVLSFFQQAEQSLRTFWLSPLAEVVVFARCLDLGQVPPQFSVLNSFLHLRAFHADFLEGIRICNEQLNAQDAYPTSPFHGTVPGLPSSVATTSSNKPANEKTAYRIKHLVRNLEAEEATVSQLQKSLSKAEYRIKHLVRALDESQ